MEVVLQPFSERVLGDILQVALKGDEEKYHSFQAAVAFAKRTGVQHIEEELRSFVESGGYVRLVIGVDYQGTSTEALSDLLQTIGDEGELWINHDENRFVSFHPKIYLFEGGSSALLIVGSGNLTEGGLFTNDEGLLILTLHLEDANDKVVIDEVKAALDRWCDQALTTVSRLDEAFLQELIEKGYLGSESREEGKAEAKAADGQTIVDSEESPSPRIPLFGRGPSRRRPTRQRKTARREKPVTRAAVVKVDEPRGFVMTLMRTDVGVGQTTPGTSRRSPEIFVPLSARNKHPGFWGWPDKFVVDPTRPGKFDRFGVQMRIGGEVINVNMMTWPDKHDFRLRSEALRSAGEEGDILRVEKTEESLGFGYYVEIIPKGTSEYNEYLALCVNKTPNSSRI